MDMKSIGRLIAEKRTALGLTQNELAERLGVSNKAVSKWERGQSCPDADLFMPLTTALKISINDLLTGKTMGNACCQNTKVSETADEPRLFSADQIITETVPTDAVVSPLMFGSNLEHTRSDIFMGLSAQMLNNRKFAGKPSRYYGVSAGWFGIGEKVYFTQEGDHWYNPNEAYTRHSGSYHLRRLNERYAQRIINLVPGASAGIGQRDLSLIAGKTYEFRIVVRCPALRLTVEMTSHAGKTVYAHAELDVNAPDWTTYECLLKPDFTDDEAEIRIRFTEDCYLDIGAVSLMPTGHFRGMRRDVIDRLKEIGVSILRWPGGNFAGEYCWEDGLLPVDQRAPLEAYQHWEEQPHAFGYDNHEINTDDFIALCREIGAQPYITINLAWNTPEENANWVEYCNGDETTPYGRIRAERGYQEPYNVKFWSLGNEMGYGHMEGDNTIQGYLKAASASADAMLKKTPDLMLASSGPYPNDDWWNCCAKKLSDRVKLVSLHHYSPSPSYKDKMHAKEDYYKVLGDAEGRVRPIIRRMHGDLGDMAQISFDEWNVWYSWFHQSNVYNGIFSALFMHIIFEEAEQCGIGVVCHFEAVNEGMIEVFADHAELTAAGQIMAAMKHHRCGRILHASRFAAVTKKEDTYTATLVNASYDEPKRFLLPKYAESVTARLYYGEKMEPCSRFIEKDLDFSETDGGLEVILPAHSAALMQFR